MQKRNLAFCPASHHPEAQVPAGIQTTCVNARSLQLSGREMISEPAAEVGELQINSTACIGTRLCPWTRLWPLNSFASAALAPGDEGHRAA